MRNVDLIRGRNGGNGVGLINEIYHLFVVGYDGIEFEKELSQDDMDDIKNGNGVRLQNLVRRTKSTLLLGQGDNNRKSSVDLDVAQVDMLQCRVHSLEESLFKFQKDYSTLKRGYERLNLENIQLRLESGGYSRSMELYSSRIINSQNEAYQTLGKIAKILSGYYHGTIDDIQQGKEEGDENSAYLWTWEDRIKAVKCIYREKGDQIKSSVKNEDIEQLFKIISHNKYVTGRYPNKLNELKNLLLS